VARTLVSASVEDLLADPTCLVHALQLAELISAASDLPAVHALLTRAATALGAECSLFVSIEEAEKGQRFYQVLLNCDATWSRRWLNEGCIENDPWLAYALSTAEPIVVSAADGGTGSQFAPTIASNPGFTSAALIPVHSPLGRSRVSLLCLGHSITDHFEESAFTRVRVLARSVAVELHDWWARDERRRFGPRRRLSSRDLLLLKRLCQGQSSKQIATDLEVTKSSIDSRFQRLIAKLDVPNRRAAARMAIDCGLIFKPVGGTDDSSRKVIARK
jgi:DNA-binding CsgD family transcriptional regulator